MVSTRGQRAARTQIVSLGFGPGRGIADDHPPDHQLVDGPSVSLVRETAFSDVFPMRSLTPREELILGPFCPGSWLPPVLPRCWTPYCRDASYSRPAVPASAALGSPPLPQVEGHPPLAPSRAAHKIP